MPQLRRGRWVAFWLLGSLAIAAVAFGVGTLVTSPWQAAVENSEEHLTAPISLAEQTFHSEIPTFQGNLTLGEQINITAPDDISHVVITESAPAMGNAVSNGDVLIGISGRPLFALQLSIPLYRDLEPGMSGPDVESLQVALGQLGLYQGIVDGKYGAGTGKAVKALYNQSNYEPPPSITETREPIVTPESAPAPQADPEGHAPSATDAESSSAAEAPTNKTVVVDLGTPLPMSEVMDLPEGDITIIGSLALGSKAEPSAEVVTLRTGAARAVVRVGVSAAEHFQLSQNVLVTFPGSGQPSLEVPITQVSDFLPGSESGAPPGYDIVAGLDVSDVEDLTDGLTISMTPAGQPESITALGVPLTALREDSDGIYVLTANETPQRVAVTLGLQSNGYAQILEGTELKVGTSILLGNTGD